MRDLLALMERGSPRAMRGTSKSYRDRINGIRHPQRTPTLNQRQVQYLIARRAEDPTVTFKQLGDELGVSRSTIGRYLRKETDPA